MRELFAVAAVALAGAAVSVHAAPRIEITGALIVGRATAEGPFTDAPTEARLDDAAELAVVLVGREGKNKVYVVDDAVAPLRIGGKAIAKSSRRDFSSIGKVGVRWSFVEPHAWREQGTEAPNGATTPYYSNVVTGGEKHGRWLGYDRITYFETPVAASFSQKEAARRIAASATPPRDEDDLHGGLGTMRYKVEVRLPDGTEWATPGAEATDRFGILPTVHRVSIRRDDTYLGWLTAYFQVPEVFGSAGPGKNHQTERYSGADCADVLVGALRAKGHKVDYSHVAGLTSYADVIVEPVVLDDDGMPAAEIAGVKVGDVIRIDYGGQWSNATPRSWDHVAVLYEDRSDPKGQKKGKPDGKLDGFDLVTHMGHPRLVVEPLSAQSPAKIDVLRWNEKKLRRR